MGGGSLKSNPTRPCLVRGKDGSAFARCEGCKKDVPVATIGFHSCSLDAKIKNNLEAQVVENHSEVKPPAARKKKLATSSAPKRPLTPFFLFMADFRKSFKEANPDSKDVKKVAKEGGEKWKLLTDEEKKLYIDKADELKAEFTRTLETLAGDVRLILVDPAANLCWNDPNELVVIQGQVQKVWQNEEGNRHSTRKLVIGEINVGKVEKMLAYKARNDPR